jgi:hypothetical protein
MLLETKIKEWTLKRWKDECWKYASIYNRRKDLPKGSDYGRCCTCGKVIHWQEGDAGHFQGGRGNSVLFHDKGTHLQCKECNGPKSGEQYKYGLYLEKRYGIEEVKYQQQLRYQTKKYSKQDFIKMIEDYKEKINIIQKYE